MLDAYLVPIWSGLVEYLMNYCANELISAKNGVKLQNWPNDLEDESQGHPLSKGVESNARFIFGI